LKPIPRLNMATVTGMRRGEVLGLTWDNVNLDDSYLIVGQTLQKLRTGLTFQPPKTARSARIVSLPQFAVKALTLARRKSQLALGDESLSGVLVCRRADGQTWEPSRLSALFRSAVEGAGLTQVHFHTLRHAQASLLLRKGLDIQATGSRLGHSTSATTLNYYAHTIQETDREAAKIIDRALSGQSKGKKKAKPDSSGAKMVPRPGLRAVGDKRA